MSKSSRSVKLQTIDATYPRGPAIDALLREHGFTIHGRRKDEEPTWSRGGHVYKQMEAITVARIEAKEGLRRRKG